jgi:hypothetical protein
MDDFERTFDAGSDAARIIDGICAAQTRFERVAEHAEQVIEHRIWFEDYATAEKWEKDHRGLPFVRCRKQGGYEVSVKAPREQAGYLANDAFKLGRGVAKDSVNLVYPAGLEDRVVSHGDFKLRLAPRTDICLDGLLAHLRQAIPPGRRELSPVCMPLNELRSSFNEATEHLSYEMNMGLGTIAIFSSDHKLLVGRRVGNEVQVWPWVLVLSCGMHDDGGSAKCFLCKHYDNIEVAQYGQPNYLKCDEHSKAHHDLPSDCYEGAQRPHDLALCIAEWIGLLRPLDAQLHGRFQSPASSRFLAGNGGDYADQIKAWCALLARAIAGKMKAECEVRVSLVMSEVPTTLPQFKPDGLTFEFTVGRQSKTFVAKCRKNDDPPDLDDKILQSLLPGWLDIVRFGFREDMENSSEANRKKDICSSWFSSVGLSFHQRLSLRKIADDLHKMDIPTSARNLLEQELPELD